MKIVMMNQVFSLLFLCVAVALASDDRIVGGDVQAANSVKYIANIKRDGGLMCGGSLITSRFILTAAHCYYSAQHILSVTVGDVTLDTHEASEQTLGVLRQVPHENYEPSTYENDIMVIEMDGYIIMNQYVQTASLSVSAPSVGTMCSVYGWGRTSYGDQISNELRGVDVPVLSKEACQTHYGSFIQDSMICLGYLGVGGKDACMGDSGGPAVCNGVLDGVVSTGIGCAEPEYPGIYTRVADYTAWIQAQVN